MGSRPAVRHMDHGRSEHGRSQIWSASRDGDLRSLLPLSRQWEWWKYPTWGRYCFVCWGPVRIEDLRGVKELHYDANPANLDDFILDWEDFAEEVVGEMRFGPDVRDKWACRTFPHCLAPELKADLRDAIREKRIRTEEQCLDWLEQEDRWILPTKSSMTCGDYL